MKCGSCGTNFEGRFCPSCGMVCEISAPSNNQKESTGLFGKLKQAGSDKIRMVKLNQKAEKGEFSGFTVDDRTLFIKTHNMPPEAYKQKLDAEKAERERIARLTSQERQFNLGGLALRQDVNGLYYFGLVFNEHAERFYLVDFKWDGPLHTQRSITNTTGTNKIQGRAGSALVGGGNW